MSLRKSNIALATLMLAALATGVGSDVAAGSSGTGVEGRTRDGARELAPSGSGVAVARKHRSAIDPVRAPEVAQAAARPTLSAVDAGTYEEWKAAAALGDSAAQMPAAAGSVSGTRAPMGVRSPLLGPTFAGMDQADAINNGYRFEPPDTQVAKGPSFVVEAANSALRMTTTTGTLVDEVDLNTFFGASHNNANGGLDLLFDPRVYYDRNWAEPRYYVAAVQSYGTGGNNGVSRIWLAISRSPDPATLNAGEWCSYGIEARLDVGTSKASWADFPQLGVGRDAIVISANQYRFTDSSFTYAGVRIFDKAKAVANTSTCPTFPYWTFRPSSSIANQNVFALQPVQAYTMSSSFKGTKNPAYLVSTDVTATTSTKLHVWRVKNVAKANPTMTWKDLTGTFTYSMPPNAPQPGATGVLLDTGDSRVQAAASRGDAISAVWDTGCQFLEGNAETCIVYARINVGQTNKGVFKASLAEQFGWGLGEDQHLFYPSVALNAGDYVAGAAQMSGSAAGQYLGTVWLLKAKESVGWPYAEITPGTCTLAAGDNLAGDYTGAQTDPGDNTGFWLGAEHAYDPGTGCTWGTTITRLLP